MDEFDHRIRQNEKALAETIAILHEMRGEIVPAMLAEGQQP